MGYFSNGTEGECYVASWCARCVHWRDLLDGRDEGCPVWDLHLLYNYAQFSKPSTASALAMFIPRGETGENLRCTMFVERGRGGPGGGEPIPVPLQIVRAA